MSESVNVVTNKKRGRGRPPVRVEPSNPIKARIMRLMDKWQTESGMSLGQMADGLNAVPGCSPLTRQALGLWATGRFAPGLERAKNGLLMSEAGTWQRKFWAEAVEAVSPGDALLSKLTTD